MEEIAVIERAMNDPAVIGVAIAGAAGVGKTRLAREFAAVASSRGCATEWVAGLGTVESIPLGAFAHLLPVPGPGAVDALSRYSGMITHIARRAADRTLVIVVDDGHLLDDASASLVYELARWRVAFLVPTVRTGEPAPAPIAALWKEELVDRLELQHLSESEVDLLLGTVLGMAVERATLRRLWEASRGNVLLLRELVLDARSSGALVTDSNKARLTAPLAAGPRLQEVVEARVRNVSASERAVLDILALGLPLGATVLRRLASPGAVESVERLGLLEVTKDGRRLNVKLAHPLYSEALRAAIPPLSGHVCRQETWNPVPA